MILKNILSKELIRTIMVVGTSCILFAKSGSPSYGVATSFSVDPLVTQIRSSNGQFQSSFILTNASENTQTFEFSLRQIDSISSVGKVNLAQKPNAAYKTLFDSIQLLDGNDPITETTLLSGQKKEITIENPKDLENISDYYFSILSESKNTEEIISTTSLLSTGVATHFLMRPAMDVPEKIKISLFQSPSFIEKGPIPFTVIVDNQGSSYTVVSGNISLRTLLGSEIDSIRLLPTLVFPDQKRHIAQSYATDELLGPYEAVLTLKTEKDVSFSRSIYFLVLPLQLLALIVVGFTLFLFLTYRVLKHLKS